MAARSPLEPTLDGIAARPELAKLIPREAAKRLQLNVLAIALVLDFVADSLPRRLAKDIVACLTRAREEPSEAPAPRLRLIRGGLRRQLEGLGEV